MPELPEVDALATFLRERAVGAVVADVEVASISVLKTFDPPVSALSGLTVADVHRFGKFLDLEVDGGGTSRWHAGSGQRGIHLVFHLARAGWLRWADRMSDTRLKLGNGPIAARVRLDAGSGPTCGFDLTEAGTRKGLALYVVHDPQQVPGIAALGPDPLADGFELAPLLRGQRTQIKRLLRDQKVIAGIGNAYSDEILHAAGLSPFALAGDLDDAQTGRLAAAVTDVLGAAITSAAGKVAADLKDAKRSGMRVHGRGGLACPVCGDTVADVVFADSSLQYCPTCQTGGKLLKDRSTSKFLK